MATVASSAPVIPRSRPVTGWARLPIWLRRTILLAALIGIWQLYVSLSNVNALLFASPVETAKAFWYGWTDGTLSQATWTTLRILCEGIGIGIVVAAILTLFATVSTVGDDLLTLLSSILNPLPGVAVLPLAMLWFGLTTNAILFVIANATIWPLALAVTTGFKTANPTILAVGRNIGLSRVRLVTDVLAPGRAPACDHRPEDRVGVRLAHGDRRRARLRGRGREGRPRLLHQQREALSPDPARVRGPGHDRHSRSDLRVALRHLARRTVVRWGMQSS